MNRAIAGVDVGGTFTDVFWLDEVNGTCRVAKVPSTPVDQSTGFIEGIRAGSQTGRVRDLTTVVHGTTVGTNALLQRSGALTGLITTEGFRDVLEMRRRDRPEIWGLRGSYTPIVKREHRLAVRERTLADGTVRIPVDVEAVKQAATKLREAGAQSLAIMFINSYANPVNEESALEAALVSLAQQSHHHFEPNSARAARIRAGFNDRPECDAATGHE